MVEFASVTCGHEAKRIENQTPNSSFQIKSIISLIPHRTPPPHLHLFVVFAFISNRGWRITAWILIAASMTFHRLLNIGESSIRLKFKDAKNNTLFNYDWQREQWTWAKSPASIISHGAQGHEVWKNSFILFYLSSYWFQLNHFDIRPQWLWKGFRICFSYFYFIWFHFFSHIQLL